ncbi:MAG: bifunctional folylpolyglutamate synthase/dihydrofolate synthase, partial [Oscillospiraceae bacterium]|nr:bifunctional folylpolyglutamate synthase/dihydrofolate synthase [Oscillospiraceae bacterium]
IHSHHWAGQTRGLGRVRELLRLLGEPQKKLKFVHVAGTNGKGSTSVMIASVLRAAGYKVGLNTSPYIMRFNERVRINGEPIGDEKLTEWVERMAPIIDAMEDQPREFDIITALALAYFAEEGCDIAVLEVGLGGELDATNVIDCPEVTVLTAMGMDHVTILGPTMKDVAKAKAGIIKNGAEVVSFGGNAVADEVFADTCLRLGAKLTLLDRGRIENAVSVLDGNDFSLAPYGGLHIPLAGAYQVKNAALAVLACEKLAEKGWRIGKEEIRAGLASAQWPARFEVLSREPVFVLDGAHNAHGIRAVAESLAAIAPKWTFLLGVMEDKDVGDMLSCLAPLAEKFVTVRPDSPRAMEADALAELLNARFGAFAMAAESVESGVALAKGLAGEHGAVCALGSLYFAGEIRHVMGKE